MRNPKRSAMAPIGACDIPQTIFWIAKRQREVGGGQRQVAGHRRQEQPEALAQPHAEAEHHGGPDQDQPGVARETGGHREGQFRVAVGRPHSARCAAPAKPPSAQLMPAKSAWAGLAAAVLAPGALSEAAAARLHSGAAATRYAPPTGIAAMRASAATAEQGPANGQSH